MEQTKCTIVHLHENQTHTYIHSITYGHSIKSPGAVPELIDHHILTANQLETQKLKATQSELKRIQKANIAAQ